MQDIGDLRLALAGAFDAPLNEPDNRVTTGVVRDVVRPSLALAFAAALAAAVVSGITAWILKPTPVERSAQIRRFAIAGAPTVPLAIAVNSHDLALTPDGTRVVYFAGEGVDRQLHVRAFDEVDGIPIRQGERFFEPFVSPDSRWVGFIDESDFTLKKISIAGGPPIPIASVGTEILGASWGPDGTIVFARNDGTGLWTVPAAGGKPKALTTLEKQREEVSHRWPEFLPSGKAVLFTIVSGQHADGLQIGVVNLETLEQKILSAVRQQSTILRNGSYRVCCRRRPACSAVRSRSTGDPRRFSCRVGRRAEQSERSCGFQPFAGRLAGVRSPERSACGANTRLGRSPGA